MSIRKFAMIGAVCIAPFAAFAQSAADGGQGSTTGGSAGDGDRPLTYTKKTFAELDKNKDGIVDKRELVGSTLEAPVVKKIDTNSDGQISQAEFDSYEAMTRGNQVPKK